MSPAPAREELRRILEKLPDADRKAVIIDRFPIVAGRLSDGMDSRTQVNLLLSLHSEAQVWFELQKAAETDAALRELVKGARSAGTRRSAPAVLPSRNVLFTGREQMLAELDATLREHRGVAVVGMGGLGKSSLALEYAHRHAAEHPLVYWLSAVDVGALGLGLTDLGRYLIDSGLADNYMPLDEEPKALRAYALSWLCRSSDWLLVLDNADDPEPLQPLMPAFAQGYLLCTTRATDPLALNLFPMELGELSPEDGVAYLLRRRGAQGSAVQAADRTAAHELAAELGHLPLALEQAAGYMAAHKTSVKNYLAAYRKRRAALFPVGASGQERHSVATVWSLSFERVESESRAAADLLRVSAFLSPDFIPEHLLRSGAAYLGEALATSLTADDPLAVDEVLGPLLSHSLIKRLPGESDYAAGYGLHRLVQDVVRLRLGSEERTWAERATRALFAAFPRVDYHSWPICHALLSCAEHVHGHIERLDLTLQEAAWLLVRASNYLRAQAAFARSEPLCRRALSIYERTLGFEHPETARCLDCLALALRGLGQLDEGRLLSRQALAIYERTLGPDHLETARCMNNLAWLLSVQPYMEEAEQLYRRGLSIYERERGQLDATTSWAAANLGWLLHRRGKLAEAEQLTRRALQTREQVLGHDHPETGQSLNLLAAVLDDQDKPAEAEALYRSALAIQEQALGPEHPHTVITRTNLTSLLKRRSPLA